MTNLNQFIKNGNCSTCPLKDNTYVPPDIIGNVDVLFIGEAPGYSEARLGQPFVGKSGQILREKIKQYLYGKYTFGITNAVKCHPINNETPNVEIIKACYPYLEKEILQAKPKVIVLLGNVALKAVLGTKSSITKMLNQVTEVNIGGHKCLVIPTYHPAKILRNYRDMPVFESTFTLLLNVLSSTQSQTGTINYLAIEGEDQLRSAVDEILATSHVFAFDIEAPLVYHPSDLKDIGIISIAVSSLTNTSIKNYVFGILKLMDQQVNWVPELNRLFASDIPKVAHNGKFDIKLLKFYGIDVRNFAFDTMIGHHLYNENFPHKLSFVISTLLGSMDYKEEFWDKFGGHEEILNREKILTFWNELLEYNAKDAYYTLLAYFKLLDKLDNYHKDLMDLLLTNLVIIFSEIELRGIKVDPQTLKSLETQFRNDIVNISAAIQNHPSVKLWVSQKNATFNPSSTQHVSEVLYEIEKLEVLETTPRGNPSTNSKTLTLLSPKSELCKLLLDYRKATKLYTAFIVGLEKLVRVGSRIYPKFELTGTKTGRLSCRDPNIQQIPKNSDIRKMFVSSFPGGRILEVDYSQIELRVAASISNDETMKKVYFAGDDLHARTASGIFGKDPADITDSERRIAKTINFGILYGMGPKRLKDSLSVLGIFIEETEARKYIDRFFATYPQLYDWIEKVKEIALAKQEVRSVFGRTRRLSGTSQEDLRQAVNFVVQSSAADLTLFSIVFIDTELKERNLYSKIIATIHDSIIVDVYPTEEKVVEEIIKDCMTRKTKSLFDWYLQKSSFEEIVGKESVPLEVDIKIGRSWGEVSEGEEDLPSLEEEFLS